MRSPPSQPEAGPAPAVTSPPEATPRGPFAYFTAAAFSVVLLALLWLPFDRDALPRALWFLGRTHPVTLHLPIGFLVGLFVLEALGGLRRSARLDGACFVLLWLTVLSAVPTAVAGACLATEGGYDSELLWRHRLLGGVTAVLSVWLLVLRPAPRRLPYYGLLLVTLAAVAGAGHFGASMTHGSDFLTRYAPFLTAAADGETAEVPAESGPGADADLFADVVQPILARRCAQCHGPEKQKVGLRLDGHAALMRGSRNGPVVVPGEPGKSRLVEVLLLPGDHDEHMPPDGKPQPTADEVELVCWWVERGAPKRARLLDLWLPPRIEAAVEAELGREVAPAAPSEATATPGEQPAAEPTAEPGGAPSAIVIDFHGGIRPLLQRYCFRCHGPEEQKGGMRLDALDPDVVAGPDAESWHAALNMINLGEMPPEEEEQPADDERRQIVAWLTDSLAAAAVAREGERRAVFRRLNKAQYTHTLQDLLGLSIDFGRLLPDDGKSKMGFTNNGEVLQASPLHIDYYQAIARDALNQAIAVGEKPTATRYRVRFGKDIGAGLAAGRTGGYQSVPLDPDDFVVDILDAGGRPQVGADEDAQAALDRIRRKISVGLRGSSQDRFRIVEEGMILFSALPHREKVPKSWQGPSPNLKLEMQRVFPETGDFAMRVRASRGFIPPTQEQLLVALDDPVPLASLAGERVAAPAGAIVLRAEQTDQRKNVRLDGDTLVAVDIPEPSSARFRVDLPDDGFYQVDLVHPVVSADVMASVRLSLNRLNLDLRPQFTEEQRRLPRAVTALGAAGLRSGRHHFKVGGPFFIGCSHLVVTRLPDEHPLVVRLTARADQLNAALADKAPAIRAFVGTRTDDGMDYKTFGRPQEVRAPLGQAETYTFTGRLENLPVPAPESGDLEELSGFLLMGLWNDHLVKAPDQTGPPLLVESIEVEAPHHPSWPPPSHTAIFFDSEKKGDAEAYTREVIARFLERAFRRPLTDGEVERYMEFWRSVRDDYRHYEHGVREVLVAALCSPNFLYLAEPEVEGAADTLTDHALASRLSYFLWNSCPDRTLLELADAGRLRGELLAQVDRMLEDPRAWRFVRAFAYEWLRLDRHAGMTIDPDRHPDYTRFVKRDMAEETYHFLHHVLVEDLDIFTLVDSDFAMLNQNLAEFYGIERVAGPRFRPVPIAPEQRRGGLLSQGAFFAGHSDGVEPHTIKRAVWLKEKILGDPPPPPPPNVPDLDPEAPGFEKLTLKEQLERHRDSPSCRDCHAGIDPYGVAFERYSAVGRYETERKGKAIDSSSALPDGTVVDGVAELKAYILDRKPDAFAASLIEHLFAYALGRDVYFADEEELAEILHQVELAGYRARSVIRAIVSSPSFTQR